MGSVTITGIGEARRGWYKSPVLSYTLLGAVIHGIGCMITATYSISFESILVNTGEPVMDVKESES